MARFKLGDRVTITVNTKAGRRRPAAPSPDVHYGAIRRIEDEPHARRIGKLTFSFLDTSSPFIERTVSANGRKVFFYTQYYGGPAGVAGTLTEAPFAWTREQLQDPDGDRNTIFGGLSGRWAMPLLNTDLYSLTFVLGSSAQSLADSNSKWIEREQTPEEEAEATAPWSLSDSGDVTSTGNLWHRLFRDYWANYAQLKLRPSARRQTWRVDTDQINFEPFDPFDTGSYKVTQGAYADPEVAPPRIDAAGRDLSVVIGLVPRFWALAGGFTEWALFNPGTGTKLFKRTATFVDECLGLTCPYVHGYQINDEPINETDYLVGTLSPVSGIFNDGAGHFPTTATFTAAFDGVPPAAAPFSVASSPSYSDDHTNFLMWMLSVLFASRGDAHITFSGDYPDVAPSNRIIERTDATIDIEVAATPVGALVGRLLHKEQIYNVYRRTGLAGGAGVYSGGFDSLGIIAPWGDATGGSYHNPYYNSFTRDFADYDPAGFVPHVTI